MRSSRFGPSGSRAFPAPVTKPSMTSSATATCSAHSSTDQRFSAGLRRQAASLTPATLPRNASPTLRKASSSLALWISVRLFVAGTVLMVNAPSLEDAAVRLPPHAGTVGLPDDH